MYIIYIKAPSKYVALHESIINSAFPIAVILPSIHDDFILNNTEVNNNTTARKLAFT